MKLDIYRSRIDGMAPSNRYMGTIEASSIEEAKQIVQKPYSEGGFNLNPAWATILEAGTDKVLFNLQYPFRK